MDILEIAPGLTFDPAGYWLTPDAINPSYPDDGNDFCLTVEEKSFWFTHRNRAIVAAVTRLPPADGAIFDIGGGNGIVTAALQTSGFPTITIEPGRKGAMNSVRRGNPYVVCGSLPSSAFLENRAGAIGLFDVIEHIPDDVSFLRSVRPYLRKNGRLYITVPAYPWLWSRNDVDSGHYRRYTRAGLAAALDHAGFRTEYATYLFAALPPGILLLRRWAGRRGQSANRIRSEHSAGGRLGRRLTEVLFSFEIGRINRGSSIPFGASCLIVATPNAG